MDVSGWFGCCMTSQPGVAVGRRAGRWGGLGPVGLVAWSPVAVGRIVK